MSAPLRIRGLEYGGARPLFCIPLVPPDLASLSEEAGIAAALKPDVIEWRADFFQDQTPERLLEGARVLRGIAYRLRFHVGFQGDVRTKQGGAYSAQHYQVE